MSTSFERLLKHAAGQSRMFRAGAYGLVAIVLPLAVGASVYRGVVGSEAAQRERERRVLSSGVTDVTRQNEALADMLKDLPSKTAKEKLEDAADAHRNFMAPQQSVLVTSQGPKPPR